MYYTYVLLLKNNKFYYGYTSNLEMRIEQHAQGLVKSTKSRYVKLLYFEMYANGKVARERETFLKSGQGRAQMKQLLAQYLKN